MRLISLLAALGVLATACGSPSPSSTTATPAAPTSATSPPGVTATVRRAFDGDSLLVDLPDESGVEVRLLGINAPEKDECHGELARQALADLVLADDVTLVADQDDVDQFGRLLRYVYVGEVNINLELLTRGDALAIQTGHRLEDQFIAADDAAAAAGRGMWAPDACGARGTPPAIAVVDFTFDPRGRDADNLNSEWIAIANRGDQPREIGGWILRDESTRNRYRFPTAFVIEVGEEVVVRSGCGADSPAELFWCAGDPVWSNGGDTIILQKNDGTVVARERYSGTF